MTSPVFTPLQMFYSTSGLPLTDGYIYIGTASQNPQTNPIAVYWDAAGTIPAAQPIRTSGGYPVRNGSPATVFVLATDFSLIVRDKSSKLVFSRLSGNAFSAEWVTYTPAGTGAVATTVQSKLRESVSVKDFGAVGDGVTDDTAEIQAAINSGAKKIVFPLGAYKTGALTLQSWTQLVGETMPLGVGAGSGPVRLVFNLASGVAITCSDNPIFENITFVNTAGTYNEGTAVLSGTTATAIKTNGNAAIKECNFYYWYECVELAGSCYYFKSSNVEFARCTYGYIAKTVAPYDVHIESPTSRLTDIFISGTATYLPRNIKVFGGSIEGYSKIARYFSDISFFGTYFETVSQRSGAFAIDPGANGASVSLYGCLVYLDHTTRFVSMGSLTNAMLTSSGNVFDGIGPAASYVFYLPSSGTVSLSGDRFGTAHANDCRYVDTLAFSDSQHIVFPKLPAANVQSAYSGLTYLGNRGYAMATLTAAPSSPISGMTVLADGSSWDPLTRAYGRPYWVTWQGDRWRTPGGLT